MQLQPLENLMAGDEAVTAIEYALMGSLILLVIVSGVGLVGTDTTVLWSLVTNCVVFATTGDGSCA